MTFATPLFLLAALAGLIPLVLHMINRQQAPVLPFSTLRFLRISVQRTRRRKYLHDVLLLVLRIAGLVLIAIALASPAISRIGGLFGSSSSSVAIVLDNSASMSTRDEGGVRWELAVKAAEQLLDELNDGDSVALIPSCGPARPDLGRLYKNHEVVRQAVEVCRVSPEKADLASRLTQARQLLEADESSNKEIYVITDMQSVSWDSLKKEQSAGPPPKKPIPVIIADTHRPALPNVALQGIAVRTAGPVAGVPATVSVKLAGDAAVEQKRHIELLFDGKPAGTSPTLSIPPGSTAEQTFRVVPEQPGVHRGEVRLVGDDASPIDNRLFFALTVDPNIPVAIVQPRIQEISYLEDGYYLERALTPVVGENWAIQITKLTADKLATEPLSPYAVIFCVNLPVPTEESARRLRDYVKGGGRLFWICGTNVDPVLYSALDDSLQHELIPSTIKTLRTVSTERPDGWHIGWIDAQHPALAPLSEPASLYQSVHVTQHVVIPSPEGSGVRPLLRLDDGEPLLVQRPIGSGIALMLGISTHVDWSNLPLRPIFLPLIARLTFQLAGAEAIQPQLVAGAPLRIPLSAASKPTVEVVRPNGDMVRVEPSEIKDNEYRYNETDEAGVYEVRVIDGKRRQLRAFAMNFDPAETAPAVLAHEALAERFGQLRPVFAEKVTDLASTVRSLRNGQSLVEPFLILVLLALVLEAYVANRRVEPIPDDAEPVPSSTRAQPAGEAARTGI